MKQLTLKYIYTENTFTKNVSLYIDFICATDNLWLHQYICNDFKKIFSQLLCLYTVLSSVIINYNLHKMITDNIYNYENNCAFT